MVQYVDLHVFTCNDKLIVRLDYTKRWAKYKSIKTNSSSEQ